MENNNNPLALDAAFWKAQSEGKVRELGELRTENRVLAVKLQRTETDLHDLRLNSSAEVSNLMGRLAEVERQVVVDSLNEPFNALSVKEKIALIETLGLEIAALNEELAGEREKFFNRFRLTKKLRFWRWVVKYFGPKK